MTATMTDLVMTRKLLSPAEELAAHSYGTSAVHVELRALSDRVAYLASIWVGYAWRGRNLGTRKLREILRDADALGVTIELHAVPEHPANRARLLAWYRSFGFVDADTPRDLVRYPRRFKRL